MFLNFLKLPFIDDAITVVPVFHLCPIPPSIPHSFRHFLHHRSCQRVKHTSSLTTPFPVYTLHPHAYSVTTYLYFLILSPLHPFPQTASHWQPSKCIHDSVSVLLVHLLCFLDSIVYRYIFIAILLFIVLTFFFLNKSL